MASKEHTLKIRPFRPRLTKKVRRRAFFRFRKKSDQRVKVNPRQAVIMHHAIWATVQILFAIFATDFMDLKPELRQVLRLMLFVCGVLFSPVAVDKSTDRYLRSSPVPAVFIHWLVQGSIFGTIVILEYPLSSYWLIATVSACIGATYLLTSSAKDAPPSAAE